MVNERGNTGVVLVLVLALLVAEWHTCAGATAFATRRAWELAKHTVDFGGGERPLENHTTHTAVSATPVYYANSTYRIHGPKKRGFSNEQLFENYAGKASDISFQVDVTPHADGLVFIDQQSGGVIVSPTTQHHVDTTTFAVVRANHTLYMTPPLLFFKWRKTWI